MQRLRICSLGHQNLSAEFWQTSLVLSSVVETITSLQTVVQFMNSRKPLFISSQMWYTEIVKKGR